MTFILLAAFGAAFLLRRASASFRHLAWSAAVIGLVLLPLASLVLASSGKVIANGFEPYRQRVAFTHTVGVYWFRIKHATQRDNARSSSTHQNLRRGHVVVAVVNAHRD
ncbi:MAG: hypothetical protein WD733_18935 [Bryobacterales bacterium]